MNLNCNLIKRLKLLALQVLICLLLLAGNVLAQAPSHLDRATDGNGTWTSGPWKEYRTDSIDPQHYGPRWEPCGAPGFGFIYKVYISHQMILDVPMSLPHIVWGQEIVLNQHLTITGTSFFTQAIMNGPDSVDVTQGATIYLCNGSGLGSFFGSNFTNNGTVEFISGGHPSINCYVSAIFTNNGIINVQNPNSGYQGFGGAGTFKNSSTGVINYNGIVYDPNSPKFTIGTTNIINDGVINSNGLSILEINTYAGTQTFNGQFNANGAGGFKFNSQYSTVSFSASSVINGISNVDFYLGTYNINGMYSVDSTIIHGASMYFNQASNNFPYLNFQGGELRGNSIKTISAKMNWESGGIKDGACTLLNTADGRIAGSPSTTLTTTFTNNAVINWFVNWYCCYWEINIAGGTFINNGTMNIQCFGATSQNISGTGGTFINSPTGVMNLSTSSNPFSINVDYFNNNGTINNNGTSIYNITSVIGLHNGTFNDIGTGGFQFMYSGSQTFTTSSTVTGKYLKNYGATLDFNGNYTMDSTRMDYGTMTFNMPSVSFRELWFNGGNLGGVATKTITGQMMLAGNLTGGTVTINSGKTCYMDGSPAINANLVNNGFFFFRTGYQILGVNIGSGITFDNNGTMEMELVGGNKYVLALSGGGTFNNNATGNVIVRNPNTAATYLNMTTFTNSGFINVKSSKVITGTATLGGIVNIDSSGILTGGDMNFIGTDFTNNGWVQNDKLIFSGTVLQNLNGNGSINNLELNGLGGINLGGEQTANNALNFVSGKINLGNSNLIMGGGCVLYGGNQLSYCIATSLGAFKRTVYNNGAAYFFPIGTNTSYLPAKLIPSFSSTTDVFSARINSNLFYNYGINNVPVGNSIAGNVVNCTWQIEEAVAGGSNAEVTLQWNQADESASFNRSNCRFADYSGGAWSSTTGSPASGSNPYTLSKNNVTSFSPFGIINQFVSCVGSFGPFTSGQSFSVPVVVGGQFDTGNVFTVQLSDATGSFSSPVNIGILTATTSAAISCSIPLNTLTGSGYKIRVVSSSPSLISPDNGSDISITATCISSTPPTSITSDANNNEICIGGNVTLTLNGGSLGSNALWKWYKNTCGGPVAGTGTSITVSPAATTNYFVRAEGCDTSACVSVTIKVSTSPVTVNAVVPFSGMPSNVCPGTVATISVPAAAGATFYTWDAPGGSYFNGNPLNVSPYTTASSSVSITFGPFSGSLYTVGVQAGNACGSSLRQVQKVRGQTSVPASISGSLTACANSTGSYSTPAVTGATQYLWTVTGDATVSGTGTTVTVTFGPSFTTGTLCVAAQTTCYTSPTKCISISTAAAALGAISGTFTVCPNQVVTYSVPVSAGAASYTWTSPANSNIISGQGTNSIQVNYLSNFNASGNICVSMTSICGVSTAVKCKTVAPGLPQQPASITGPGNGLCGQTVVYSCPSQGAGVTYNWTVPSGATIQSGQGSTSISVQYGTFSTGSVCVTAQTSCGSGPSRCIPVKGAPNAPSAITATPACWLANTAGIQFDANVSNITGSYTLSWTYPAMPVANYVSGAGNSSQLNMDWGMGSGNIFVTAGNGCGSATKTSTWSNSPSCRLALEALSNAINVSPNPTTGKVNIAYTSSKGHAEITLTDLAGRVVMQSVVATVDGLNNTQLDMSKLAKGTYVLNMTSAISNTQVKVVVE